MAAQASPLTSAASDLAPCVPRSMRIDPTGRPVQDEVPDSLLKRWRDDRAAYEAELSRVAALHAAETQNLRNKIGDLRGIVIDSHMVAHDLRGLVYLFEKALTEDGPDTPLTTASHIVIDCIRTMAARLEALEERASTACAAGRAE